MRIVSAQNPRLNPQTGVRQVECMTDDGTTVVIRMSKTVATSMLEWLQVLDVVETMHAIDPVLTEKSEAQRLVR